MSILNTTKWLLGIGSWIVVYSDGQRSMPMSRENAKTYSTLFGGDVVPTDRPILHLGLR